MAGNNHRKRRREHELSIYRYPTAVDHAARERWSEASDLRRIIVGLSSLPLDATEDQDLITRIELWAVAEGKRLEDEDARGRSPNFDGMIGRLISAIGEAHVHRILNGSGAGSSDVRTDGAAT